MPLIDSLPPEIKLDILDYVWDPDTPGDLVSVASASRSFFELYCKHKRRRQLEFLGPFLNLALCFSRWELKWRIIYTKYMQHTEEQETRPVDFVRLRRHMLKIMPKGTGKSGNFDGRYGVDLESDKDIEGVDGFFEPVDGNPEVAFFAGFESSCEKTVPFSDLGPDEWPGDPNGHDSDNTINAEYTPDGEIDSAAKLHFRMAKLHEHFLGKNLHRRKNKYTIERGLRGLYYRYWAPYFQDNWERHMDGFRYGNLLSYRKRGDSRHTIAGRYSQSIHNWLLDEFVFMIGIIANRHRFDFGFDDSTPSEIKAKEMLLRQEESRIRIVCSWIAHAVAKMGPIVHHDLLCGTREHMLKALHLIGSLRHGILTSMRGTVDRRVFENLSEQSLMVFLNLGRADLTDVEKAFERRLESSSGWKLQVVR